MTDMQIERFWKCVHLKMMNMAGRRYGQIISEALYEECMDVYSKTVSTKFDPYYEKDDQEVTHIINAFVYETMDTQYMRDEIIGG